MKKRILLVDDEPDFTDTMRLVLEADGYYEVAVENDALRALSAAREFDPDLIVLDVMMPEVDGTDVAATLREDPRFANVPIVFMTALVSTQEAKGAHGAKNTYLPKQTPVDELIDVLEEKLAGTRALAVE
jgi:CheY-like chemotaxis protein